MRHVTSGTAARTLSISAGSRSHVAAVSYVSANTPIVTSVSRR